MRGPAPAQAGTPKKAWPALLGLPRPQLHTHCGCSSCPSCFFSLWAELYCLKFSISSDCKRRQQTTVPSNPWDWVTRAHQTPPWLHYGYCRYLGTPYFPHHFETAVGIWPPSRSHVNSTFLPCRPVHDAACDSSWTTVAVTVVFCRNEISSSLAIFEMCHLDYCAQSCAELFSYVLTTVCQYIWLSAPSYVFYFMIWIHSPEKGFYMLC